MCDFPSRYSWKSRLGISAGSPSSTLLAESLSPTTKMFVGVLRLSFHIPAARSLKDKRQVVRSFRDRVRARLDVSIAEVADLDLHRRATFGVAVVSSDAKLCDELLASVASLAENVRDAILIDRATKIESFASMLVPFATSTGSDEDE